MTIWTLFLAAVTVSDVGLDADVTGRSDVEGFNGLALVLVALVSGRQSGCRILSPVWLLCLVLLDLGRCCTIFKYSAYTLTDFLCFSWSNVRVSSFDGTGTRSSVLVFLLLNTSFGLSDSRFIESLILS